MNLADTLVLRVLVREILTGMPEIGGRAARVAAPGVCT